MAGDDDSRTAAEVDTLAPLRTEAPEVKGDREDEDRDETTQAVDEILVPYTFGRTPSLKFDALSAHPALPLAPQETARPRSERPTLAHRPSSLSSRLSVSTTSSSVHATAPPRPFALPPGLAAHSPVPPASLASSSTLTAPRPAITHRASQALRTRPTVATPQPRSARIDYEPPIPLDVQILLLTTPPPPQRKRPPVVQHTAEEQALREELLAAERERVRRANEREGLVRRFKALRLLNDGVNYLSGRRGSTDETAGVGVEMAALRAQETLDLNPQRKSKEAGRRSGRMDSRTPDEYVPKTWKDFESAYASSQVDLDDPPFPPLTTPTGISATFPSVRQPAEPSSSRISPYEAAHFPAPLGLSPITPVRERLIAQLDLLGETYILPATAAASAALHVSTAVSPVPSLASASSATSGRRDSFFQSTSSTIPGRRESNASTAPSTAYSHPSPVQKSMSGAGGSAVFPSHPLGASTTHAYTTGATATVDVLSAITLRNHPALRTLLQRALYAPLGSPALFKPAPKAAIITLFPSSSSPSAPLTILASLNLPTRISSLPLSHALDAHVVLAGERGLVVPDTERDWRFRGNEIVCTSPSSPRASLSKSHGGGLGIRFYAGMPIFAPSLPSLAALEEEAGGRIAIGTVALLDDWPRTTKFGSSERAKLRSLASEVTRVIERFLHEREQHNFSRTSTASSRTSAGPGQTIAAPSSQGHAKKVSFDAGQAPGRASDSGYVDWSSEPSRRDSQSEASREGSAAPQATSSLPPILASTPSSSIFMAACTSLAETLALDLVYLVSLDLRTCPPAPSINGSPGLTLLASHNLPQDSNATFDPALHLRALRAPEGGLLYRSPSSSARGGEGRAGGFASGILLPIAETDNERGWVLAGYTTDRKKKWGEKEMDQFDRIREGLAKVVLWKEQVGEGP